MYYNSKVNIKLVNKVSESLKVLTGTEQGRPMSPEFLKCSVGALGNNKKGWSRESTSGSGNTTITNNLVIYLEPNKNSVNTLLSMLLVNCAIIGHVSSLHILLFFLGIKKFHNFLTEMNVVKFCN